MLLIGTGLALRSLWSLRNVNLGFRSEQVLTFRIAAPSQLERLANLRLLSRCCRIECERSPVLNPRQWRAIFPLSGTDPSMPIHTEDKTPPPPRDKSSTRFRAVGDGYFRTLKYLLLQGRAFNDRDTAELPACGHRE